MYAKLKLYAEGKLARPLRLLSYHVSSAFYFFTFMYGDQEFFLRQPINEVLLKDVQVGGVDALLSNDSTIYHIQRKNIDKEFCPVTYSIKNMSFKELQKWSSGHSADFIVVIEELVDMQNRPEMFYFLTVLPQENKKSVRDLQLNVLDINTLELKITQPINF